MKYSTEKLTEIETTLKSIVDMIKPNEVPCHTNRNEDTSSQKLDNIEESLKSIVNAISSGTTTNLVVSGVKPGTLGLQLAKLLANNDIDLKDWDLLTTRSDATFLTFKIKMSVVDGGEGVSKI